MKLAECKLQVMSKEFMTNLKQQADCWRVLVSKIRTSPPSALPPPPPGWSPWTSSKSSVWHWLCCWPSSTSSLSRLKWSQRCPWRTPSVCQRQPWRRVGPWRPAAGRSRVPCGPWLSLSQCLPLTLSARDIRVCFHAVNSMVSILTQTSAKKRS